MCNYPVDDVKMCFLLTGKKSSIRYVHKEQLLSTLNKLLVLSAVFCKMYRLKHKEKQVEDLTTTTATES